MEMETEIKAGDVVELKSGGGRMTVEYVIPNADANKPASAHVIWMSNAERRTAIILVSALKVA